MSSPEDAADPTADSSAAEPATSPADPPAGSDPDRGLDVATATDRPSVPVSLLDDAREQLRIERRILSDERAAFQAFADRLLAANGAVASATIESHYRETVMAVPHYVTEYGDRYAESVGAEIGRTLAVDLQRRDRVDAPTVDAIRRAAVHCRTCRDRLIDRIDAERHALRTSREAIDAIRKSFADTTTADATVTDSDATDAVGDANTGDATFGDATADDARADTAAASPKRRSRLRLAALRARCDDVARRRRERLAAGLDGSAGGSGARSDGDRDDGDDPAEGLQPGQLQSLCYRGLDDDRPVLAVVDALRREIERRRRRLVGRGSEPE